MKRYVCIHGHFYQPPRENPWLEAIEQQDSAYPYHDWNERITDECFGPNARSRILDGDGWIVNIVNNYARMSFNFGPTLLSWMKAYARPEYEAILEADRESAERFGGHGSAIAQGYGHLILPLANERDRWTQVAWGIADFRHHFGREPEGMWLPETAANTDVLEVLAAQGIRYTILAPRQAARFRRKGETEWTECEGDDIDPSRAYVQNLPSGRSIALFFYDGHVSQAVAFERLLDSGEVFSERILTAFSEERDWPQLAHIGTDGETYGHHHRNGDMALAYALSRIEDEGLAELINYGQYLDLHPPEVEVEIREDTSWSCYHGVERWRSDCGCSTGGRPEWNQRWRRPLREALDWLRDELATHFGRAAGELFEDPWAARDGYIEVILDRGEESLEAFFTRFARRPLEPEERTRALLLFELQRHAMLMYTSCGWFFDELSGIETVQVIQYAGRAIQIAEESLGVAVEEGFLERLELAKSNLPRMRDGRHIYGRFVRPAVVDLAEVAAHSAISSLFDDDATDETGMHSVYCYDADVTSDVDLRSGRARLRIGRVDLVSRVTRRTGSFRFGFVGLGDHIVTGGVASAASDGTDGDAHARLIADATNLFSRGSIPEVLRLVEDHFGPRTYSLASLFRDQQLEVLERVLDSTLEDVRLSYRRIYERHEPLMRFHSTLGVPVPRAVLVAAEFVVNDELAAALESRPPDVARVRALLSTAEEDSIPLDEVRIAYVLEEGCRHLADHLRAGPLSLERLRAIAEVIALRADFPFRFDLDDVQNVVFELIAEVRPHVQEGSAATDDNDLWLATFDELCQQVRVRVSP